VGAYYVAWKPIYDMGLILDGRILSALRAHCYVGHNRHLPPKFEVMLGILIYDIYYAGSKPAHFEFHL
jgi:hypothetical protein